MVDEDDLCRRFGGDAEAVNQLLGFGQFMEGRFRHDQENLILLCEQFFQVRVLDGVPFRSVHAAVIGDARAQEFFDIEWGMAVIDIRQDLGCLVRCDVAFELGDDEAESCPGETDHHHDACHESRPVAAAPQTPGREE